MGETLTARVATAGDLARIDGLLARSYPILLKPDYPPSVLVTALPRISRANPQLVTSGSYYVVEGNGSVAGAGGSGPVPPRPVAPRRAGPPRGMSATWSPIIAGCASASAGR